MPPQPMFIGSQTLFDLGIQLYHYHKTSERKCDETAQAREASDNSDLAGDLGRGGGQRLIIFIGYAKDDMDYVI